MRTVTRVLERLPDRYRKRFRGASAGGLRGRVGAILFGTGETITANFTIMFWRLRKKERALSFSAIAVTATRSFPRSSGKPPGKVTLHLRGWATNLMTRQERFSFATFLSAELWRLGNTWTIAKKLQVLEF